MKKEEESKNERKSGQLP